MRKSVTLCGRKTLKMSKKTEKLFCLMEPRQENIKMKKFKEYLRKYGVNR